MDNEKLTEKLFDIANSVARIEENTSCIPKLRDDFEAVRMQVHDNTEFRYKVEPLIGDIHNNTKFRKNTVKVVWISIGACITSVVAFVFSLIRLNRG